jgi:hypothetical protein
MVVMSLTENRPSQSRRSLSNNLSQCNLLLRKRQRSPNPPSSLVLVVLKLLHLPPCQPISPLSPSLSLSLNLKQIPRWLLLLSLFLVKMLSYVLKLSKQLSETLTELLSTSLMEFLRIWLEQEQELVLVWALELELTLKKKEATKEIQLLGWIRLEFKP